MSKFKDWLVGHYSATSDVYDRKAVDMYGKVISVAAGLQAQAAATTQQAMQDQWKYTNVITTTGRIQPTEPAADPKWDGFLDGMRAAGTELEKEDRAAWDRYVIAALVRYNAEAAIEAADLLLAERRKRFQAPATQQ